MAFPTMTDLKFWRGHQPLPMWAWAWELDRPDPTPSIHRCVNSHAGITHRPRVTTASDCELQRTLEIIKMRRRRGMGDESCLLDLTDRDLCEAHYRRWADARKWLRRMRSRR